ncbi:hypothetical protein B9Z55_003789 [Caenorhabditis nigoni]|nr:hypothetical protein B9Z55_003789 [Caenorhabditis nigoni]
MSMSLFANHFIYRYMVLSRSKILRDSDGRTIIFMILFSIVFGVVWGLLAWDTMQPFPEADLMVNERFAIPMGLSLDQIAYVGVLFYTKDAYGNRLVHWPSVVGIGIQSVFIGISITIILIFGFKCYQETNKIAMNASERRARIQSQLFYALVFQTLIPICLIHIPASIVYAVAAMDSSNEYFGQFLSISVCLYPALDPLPNFFIIKSYKKAIKDFFKTLRYRLLCQKMPSVSPNGTLSRPWDLSNNTSLF